VNCFVAMNFIGNGVKCKDYNLALSTAVLYVPLRYFVEFNLGNRN